MPTINIKERDLTTNEFVYGNVNAIFVTESSLSGVTITTSTGGTQSSSIFTTQPVGISKVSTTYSGAALTGYEITSTDKTVYTLTTSSAVAGLDFISQALGLGAEVYAASAYGTVSGGIITEGPGAYIADRNQYDIKLLVAGEADDTLSGALAVAQARKDAAVILSTTSATVTPATYSLCSAGINYAKGFYSDERVSYAGKYVIPVYGKTLTGDVTNPAYAWVLAYLYSVQSGNAEWLPVAGYKRGYIPGVKGAGFITESELDKMQPKTDTGLSGAQLIAVNPICNVNPWGVRIWGNRTALPIDKTGATSTTNKLVASSFANIRMLLCDIKKAMYRASKEYQFEQNTDVLWVNFTSKINSTLETMKSTFGIAAYRWFREAPERATINAKLQIIPIEGVEDFNLTIELSDELLEVAE